MLKQKYLHRSSRRCNDRWYSYDYKEDKNIDMYSDALPSRKKMSPKHNYNSVNTDPLGKFLESKVGCDWNDVYSEIISKTKKKFRIEIENALRYYIMKPTYDENYMPVLCNFAYHRYGVKTLVDKLFIGLDNKICKMSEDEIVKVANSYTRRDKMRQLMENIKKEQEEQERQERDQELSS